MTNWWQSHDTLLAVADYGVETGMLDTPASVVYFFEKPWKHTELRQAFLDDQREAAERQWQARYSDV